MTERILDAKLLTEDNYKGFVSVYNDFRDRAIEEYKFELEPLPFDDFIDAVNKNLISCIALFENEVPTAFLIYTTAISEAIELNIIHCMNSENLQEQCCVLIKKFLELTKNERADKIVCYPMLGLQKNLIGEIARFGFKFVGIAVLRFMMSGTNSREIFKLNNPKDLESGYKLVNWSNEYFDDAVDVIQEGFATSADALFDPRFLTTEGTYDVINKVVNNVYAEFLPEATTVLLHNEIPVGFFFVNLTANSIANAPLLAIKKNHQGKGLSKFMLRHSMEKIMSMSDAGERPITELNLCTETNNFSLLKLYRHLGFKEDYSYPQSYLPVKNY